MLANQEKLKVCKIRLFSAKVSAWKREVIGTKHI